MMSFCKDWSQGKADDAPRALQVVYAGNIGEGQGLHAILPQLAQRLGGRAQFRVIGDGGRRELLLERLRQAGVHTVEVLPPMPRSALLEAYSTADILFLHLNAQAAFEKVLPSKIFEYAATGKPIWAGVAGYAAQLHRGRGIQRRGIRTLQCRGGGRETGGVESAAPATP